MRNSKKLFRLICLPLTAVMLFSLTGCFSYGGYENYNSNSVLNTEISGYELNNLIQEEWENSKSSEQPAFLSVIDSRSSFEYLDYSFDGASTYTIRYNVSSPDIRSVLFSTPNNTEQTAKSEEDINKELTNMINSAEIKTTEQIVYVFVSQLSDEDPQEIDIKFTDGFIDAMFCYSYISATNAIIEEESRMWEGF